MQSKEQGRISQTTLLVLLSLGAIFTALGFSALQEKVFRIPGFLYGGWMTFFTYLTYATCAWIECIATRTFTRHGNMRDFAGISVLAMGGAYFTNWALNYINYTTRIVFKSCRVLPVMLFRSVIVGQKYTIAQYGAGIVLVTGITLFTIGDASLTPSSHLLGVILIVLALICDALTANLEERQFFRIKVPCSHSEVMLFLSLFAAIESFFLLYITGEVWPAMEHSLKHTETVPIICAFSILGYVTVVFILLIIKNFGSTSAEIVKSLRKVCQVIISFLVFPKPMTWKHLVGGLLVACALALLQRSGKSSKSPQPVEDRDFNAAVLPVRLTSVSSKH